MKSIQLTLVCFTLVLFSGCQDLETEELTKFRTPDPYGTQGDINDNFGEFEKIDYIKLGKLNKSNQPPYTNHSLAISSFSAIITDLYDPKGLNYKSNLLRNQSFLELEIFTEREYFPEIEEYATSMNEGIYIFIGKFGFRVTSFEVYDEKSISLKSVINDRFWEEIIKETPDNSPVYVIKSPLFDKNEEKIFLGVICENCANIKKLDIPKGHMKEFQKDEIIDLTNSITYGKISNKNTSYGLANTKIIFSGGGKNYETITNANGDYVIDGGMKLEKGVEYTYEVFYKNESVKRENFTISSIERPFLLVWVDVVETNFSHQN